MTPLVPILFNLIVNAVGSFWGALLLVHLLVRGFRIGSGTGRLVLFLVPIGKVIWDLVRGIPGHSFLWRSLHGAQQDLGQFMLGIGMQPARPPAVRFLLHASSNDALYPQSAADVLYRGLSESLSPLVPALLVAIVTGVGALLLALRIWNLAHFVRQTNRLLEGAKVVEQASIGSRRVRVYSSPAYQGVPFAALAIRPHVLFSATTWSALDPEERRATLFHELAHLRYRDPALILALFIVGDVFWFLPGLRGLLRRLFRELELRADADAVRRGAAPTALARAILSAGENAVAVPVTTAGLSHRSSLSERVERLIETPPDRTRALYRHWLGRLTVFAVIVPAILFSIFLGNF